MVEIYHPVVEKIKSLLTEHGFWFETFEHEAVRTSEDASKLRHGYTLQQGAKAIIARIKKDGQKKFAMIVLPADKKFDTAKLKNNFGITDVRFATEAEVAEITGGVLPGGVPPFGNLFGLDIYLEQSLLDNEKIVFNAGDRSYSIAMRSVDYVSVVNPTQGSLA